MKYLLPLPHPNPLGSLFYAPNSLHPLTYTSHSLASFKFMIGLICVWVRIILLIGVLTFTPLLPDQKAVNVIHLPQEIQWQFAVSGKASFNGRMSFFLVQIFIWIYFFYESEYGLMIYRFSQEYKLNCIDISWRNKISVILKYIWKVGDPKINKKEEKLWSTTALSA